MEEPCWVCVVFHFYLLLGDYCKEETYSPESYSFCSWGCDFPSRFVGLVVLSAHDLRPSLLEVVSGMILSAGRLLANITLSVLERVGRLVIGLMKYR